MDENTFMVTDQVEREIIWNALEEYRQHLDPTEAEMVTALIERVSQTFAWMRD